MTERADGVIELRAAPARAGRSAMVLGRAVAGAERKVDEHVAAGRVPVHESTEDFLGHLDELDELDAE